jgi:hypothetical protein
MQPDLVSAVEGLTERTLTSFMSANAISIRGRGRWFARFAVEGARAYPRAMPSGPSAAIDRWLQDLIVTWARRQWPALRLLPARWIRPAVAPTALRLRRLLSRGILTAGMPVGIVLALLVLKP